jgi:hypothetical protein
MSLTYSTLQTTVMDYLDRTDLSGVLPTFIELAEAKLKRRLRHWKMEKRATANTVASQRTLELPTDFIEMRHLKLNTDPYTVLEYLSPAVLNFASTLTDRPAYYSVVGDEIVFEPTPDAVYEVEMYYYALPALSSTNTSNWLLEKYPDIYIYGTLLEAEVYLMNDPRLPIWKMAFDEGIQQLNKEARITRAAGAPLIQRVS